MAIPIGTKQLLVAHAHLRNAAAMISASLAPYAPDNVVAIEDVTNTLENANLLICMDCLAARATSVMPRGGFWRLMERAATTLGETHRANAYRREFNATLNRKGVEQIHAERDS